MFRISIESHNEKKWKTWKQRKYISFENPCGTMLVGKGICDGQLEFHLQDDFVCFVALLKPRGCELSCLNG